MAKLKPLSAVLLVCTIILAASSAYLFYSNSKQNTVGLIIDDFELQKQSFTLSTQKMNVLMEEYNSPKTLTFDRLDIIEEYLALYESEENERQSFRDFITSNKDLLEGKGYDVNLLIQQIDDGEKVMLSNIIGFKLDLDSMDDSILLQYKPSEKERLLLIKEELTDY